MTAQDAPAPPAIHAHWIDRLWRLMTSDRLLAALLVLLALTVLVGLLVPQVPSDLSQPEDAVRWLTEASGRFGGLGTLMQVGGLFDLQQSPWLRLLVGLLAFVLLLRLAQSVSRLQPANPQSVAAAAQRWPLQAGFTLTTDVDTALAEVADDLRQEGWQVATQRTETAAHVAAQRSRVGLWAAPLIYAGALLCLLALWIGQVFGWQETGLVLLPGQPTPLQRDSRQSLTLVQDKEGMAAVAWQTAGGEPVTRTLSAAGTARLPGMTVRRTGAGQMLTATAWDAAGAPLQLRLLDEQSPAQTTANLVFDQPRAERAFLVPARQIAFSVVAFAALPERGFNGPTYLVQAFQVGQREPLFNEFIEGDASLTIGDDRYDLRSGQYVTVRTSNNPGTPLLVLGGLLAAGGVMLGLVRPTGLLYLHIQRQRHLTHTTARLQPSPAWRQGGRWLAAWVSTYSQQLPPGPPGD